MKYNTKTNNHRQALPQQQRRPAAGHGHCMRMLSLLSDQIDRRGRSRLCRRIEEHLKGCPKCRMYVDTLRKTVVLYRGLGEESMPAAVEQRLFKTIRLAETDKKPVEGKTRNSSKLEMESNKTVAKRRKTCLSLP